MARGQDPIFKAWMFVFELGQKAVIECLTPNNHVACQFAIGTQT